MRNVNNKKAINNLAIKSFTAAKTRNLIAVVAIALTTILFTSLFTVGMGMVESIQQQTVRQAGGDGHIVLKYITQEQYQAVKTHNLINKISYNKIITDSVDNIEFLKRGVEVYQMDAVGRALGFCEPTTGVAPVTANEVAMDTQSLHLLGVPAEIGAKVPLQYTIKGKQYRTNFVLSGFWEADPATPVGFGLVSATFAAENTGALENTFRESRQMSGTINAYIMCKNSFNLEEKMNRIITESGYTLKDDDRTTPPLVTDIIANTNWAYISGGSMDAGSMLGGTVALLLFAFAGYLIIYNVFQISVQRDIRFYGLLKTIGTTGRQIKRILHRHALMLSLIGIPSGLIFGFLIGKSILPLVMNTSSYIGDAVVSANPVIFIGAALFALVTVIISTKKPAKIAAAVSPVEAVKYSGSSEIRRTVKRSKDGGKAWRMAFSNLSRNKKRTVVTIISLSLSLVLLNTVFTVVQGFDMDKYVSRFVDTDYLAGHANYFNMNHFRQPEDGTSEKMIAAIEEQEGFLEGGRLYNNIYVGTCSIQRKNPAEPNKYYTNMSADGMPMLNLYGLENLPLVRLDIVEGTLDLEKLKTGKYIIEGLGSDDDGNIYSLTSHYEIGDTVTINVDGKQHSYELLAKTKTKHYTNTNRFGSNYTMYLPKEAYLQVVSKPLVMSYAFNVKDGAELAMDDFLQSYTENVESLMNFESKAKYISNFESTQTMFITVGGALCTIIGLIGLLNFVNSILTGIITRRREFATLQSIGMTKRQLIQLLMFEGGYYTLLTVVTSLLVGVLFSVGVVGTLVSKLWFFTYKFTLLPLAIACPILFILGLIIPWITYKFTGKESIVERLREVE